MSIKQKIYKGLKNLRDFRSLSIIVLPDYGKADTRTYKFGIFQIISILALYAVTFSVLGFVILGLTPLREAVLPGGGLSKADLNKINELNLRLNQVTRELEHLKNTNERLKFAIGLGDSTIVKSLENKKDTNVKKPKKNPYGGNIFAILSEFLQDKKQKQLKSYFFTKPVDSFISRGFEPARGHMGIDFVVKTGTPVYASANGYVIFADYTTKDGYMIILNHNSGYISIYKHCSVLLKRARETVFQGETIALSGNTGEISTGPHLHFEIWKEGEPIDPKSVLINY